MNLRTRFEENSNKIEVDSSDRISRIMHEAEDVEIRPEDRNEQGDLLVSPESGLVSNLGKQNELWWKIARTKSFKDFFGDWQNNPKLSSKVVDQNGEPLVVFRGIRKKDVLDFYNQSLYESKDQDKINTFGSGVYTTPLPKLANKYAEEANGAVASMFVDIKNPKYTNLFSEFKKFVSMFVPKKLLKVFEGVFSDNDGTFGHSNNTDKIFTNEASELYEILVNNVNQILVIPSSFSPKIEHPVADYAQSTVNRAIDQNL